MDYTVHHHGILLMCDVQGLPSHLMSCGKVASGIWTTKYCILFQQKLSMLGPQLLYRDNSRSLSASEAFDSLSHDDSFSTGNKLQQLEIVPGMKEKSLEKMVNKEGRRKKKRRFKLVSSAFGRRRNSTRRRSIRSHRRTSTISRQSRSTAICRDAADAGSDLGRRNRVAEGQRSNHLSNDELNTFLQKKISPGSRRPKHAKFSVGKDDGPSLPPSGSNSRHSHFDLPFYMPKIEAADQINLASCGGEFAGAIVRPLHYSILGRDHCFEVVAGSNTRCFACGSAGERQAWIEKIKRAIRPNLDSTRRTEHQLILFVQEAKGLPSKKKYFCEICLDRKLCARTTSKWKNESGIFWAEHFEFTPMPGVQDVTVHLYKDSDKKRKKDKDYIGLVNLPISSLLNQQSLERWYTLSTPSGNNKNKAGESLALRIKARFISTRVLPTEMYKKFAEYISNNYLKVSHALSNVISVTRKDEIARILVHIMHGTGCITKYMTDVVMDEVDKVEEESLIFRENTIGTKSVEAILRLVGMKYLNDILGDFIQALFNMEDECEVDGSRLPPHASLETNQKNLLMSCEIALCKIVNSINIFPGELREVMSSWRVKCEIAGRPRIASRLVTASLFLRLLCPAIFNPSLFGLAREVPDARVSRALTLIAKVIQNLANRTRFGNKEEYMQFMDVFVREKWDEMGAFIANVSDPAIPALPKGFEGYIDLGKEFAKLHAFFVEVLKTLNKETIESLGELPELLNEITELLERPNNPSQPSTSGTRKGGSVSSEYTHKSVGPFQSLMELRDFPGASGDAPCVTPDDTFPLIRQNSQPSLLTTCVNNNNNNRMNDTPNNTSLISDRTSAGDNSQQAPLALNNPAYKMVDVEKRTSLSQLHDSLNLHRTSMLRNYKFNQHPPSKSEHIEGGCQSGNIARSPPQPPPPSNSVQSLSGSQHLETTFAAETMTYTTSHDRPSQLARANMNSNNSTLSTRESSSTSTAPSSSDDLSSDRSDQLKSALPIKPPGHVMERTNSKALGGVGAADDGYFLLSPETVSRPVSSAQLKTGLQSRPQHQQGKGDAPQPKPRSNLPRDHPVANRKGSMPVVQANVHSRPIVRRGSTGVPRGPLVTEESTPKYPKFELTRVDHSAVLKLEPEHPSSSRDGSDKYDEDLVAAPVAAVKSRIVVSTANANRVKTCQHTSSSSNKYKVEVSRRPSYPKGVSSKPSVHSRSTHQPPTPSEGPLSPEARTAQWILNNNLPSIDKEGDDIKAVLFSKDYEDRILRLESEVERLRNRLRDEGETKKNLEQKEAAAYDKLRTSQKRESNMRKQLKEKEYHIQTLIQKLSGMEGDIQREREDFLLQRKQLEKQIQNKDQLLRDQQAVLTGLHRKAQVLDQIAPSTDDTYSKNIESNLYLREDANSNKS